MAAAIVAVLLALAWLAVLQRSRFEARQATAAALEASANLAIAYKENAQSAIEDVDQLLRMTEIEYRHEGPAVREAITEWRLDRGLVAGLAVFAGDGRMVVANGEAAAAPGPIDEALAAHRASPAAALRIGRPQPIVLYGRRVMRVAISRRFDGDDGSFAGAAVAIVDPAFFTRFLSGAGTEHDGLAALVGLDGTALAWHSSSATRFGDDMRGSTLMALVAKGPLGSFTSGGRRDGISRLVSFRALDHYPFVVMVGTSLQEVLAPVAARARIYRSIAGLASLAVVLVALGIVRSLGRQRRDFIALAEAQSRMREGAARLAGVTESMAGGVVTASDDGTILTVNGAAAEMHGYDRHEMIGMPLSRLVHESGQAGLAARLAALRSEGAGPGPEQREILARRKDGATFEAEVLGSTIEIDGRRQLVGIVHDISRRKALERTLRRSEALYRATFDQAMIAIVHTNLDGQFIRANPTACEMLGYTQQEMLALGYRDVTHPEDLEVSAARHAEHLADPTKPFEYHVTRRFLRKDGSILWGLTAVGVVRDDDGMPEFFLTLVQDVTALKRVEEMKSEFVSNVSHELRSPLTSIRGSLGLLAGGVAGVLPKAARDLVVIAERNSQRLGRLVNDILDTEKMDSGRMRFELQVTALRGLTERALESMEGYAREHGVALRLAAPEEPLLASVDADRFIQVMANLLSNAVKFSPAGATVDVVLARALEGRARIEVQDRGPGIPKEFQSRMFQRFSQADTSTSRAKGGTGLGLYIAKGIVERMGGTLGFRTAPGQGTTFEVQLPEALAAAPVRALGEAA